MEKVLSILGLIVSSASAIWLLAHEIREKDKTANRLRERKECSDARKGFQSDLIEIARNLDTAYKNIDPTGEKRQEKLKENTAYSRERIEQLESEIAKIDEKAQNVEDAMPSTAHLWGFGLLLLGFVLQLIAEIMK